MSIREKICSHKSSRQVETAHGLFCLDCGQLEAKALKNTHIVQKNPSKLRLPSTLKTASTQSPLISRHASRLDLPPTSSSHIKISMADITPKKRPT